MEKLDCDYLDLYLMHFPVGYQNINDNPFPMDASGKQSLFDELDYMITYEKMEDLIKSGQECVVEVNFKTKEKYLDYKKVQRTRFIQFQSVPSVSCSEKLYRNAPGQPDRIEPIRQQSRSNRPLSKQWCRNYGLLTTW